MVNPSIKSLYGKYFQKSRVFLYPALDIKRGGSVVPIETYISWKDKIKPEDRRLICLYHLRDDPEYKTFEKAKLLGNPLFEDFYPVENNKAIYIFNYDLYDTDWDHFLSGRYSKLSPELKRRIKQFVRTDKNNSVYIDSFLHPDRFYSIYSDLLGVDINLLQEVGELCTMLDHDKESIDIKVCDNSINQIINSNI